MSYQGLRFRKPTNVPEKPISAPAARHTGILQDQLRRAQRRPWAPSFSLAIRLLFLIRIAGAMYSNIDDCDEVYNFWEPLHFLEQGYGFQTWELSPKFALRSWAYILLHYLPPQVGQLLANGDKRAAFFAVRIFLATISVFVEAIFYRTIVDKINERVGRYYFFMMFFSAGMWSASTSFLPSSFAMYTSTLAFAYAFTPNSSQNNRRTLATTLIFATGGIIGWPFALALALPFVTEELFIHGEDLVTPETKVSWMLRRWTRLFMAGLAALLVLIPVIGIDSLAYGKLVIVPWNIVRYNIFGGSERGPNLYGTAPWNFYLYNLVLNFNCILPLALLSLPALGVTYIIDRKRLGVVRSTNQSSPFTVLSLRLAPLYLWFGILSLQPHKEERFMFPAYPLLCFNAAVALYLMRGWLEVAFIKFTNSPYRASQSLLFRNFTLSVVVTSGLISAFRILALWHYYHAPLTLAFDFQYSELPRLLKATGLLPTYPENMREEDIPLIDLSPVKQFDLKLCFGKEWHRFPGNYLVPSGIQVEFIKSEFDGMLPRHFETEKTRTSTDEANDIALVGLTKKWWLKPQTSYVPNDLNDMNKEDPSHYVPVEECDYLIDLDFPLHPISSTLEPRYAIMDETWERVACYPFLDAKHSFILTRIFWLPGESWRNGNEFGDYCLLKNWKRVEMKEMKVRRYI